MMPVGVTVPPLIEQLRQSTEVLKQAVDHSVAVNKPINPPLAAEGTLGTRINTYA